MRLSTAAPFLTCIALAAAAPAGDGALQSAKNVGLAALEEGNLAEAAKRFEIVRRLAPAEPLGWADGAVAALRAKAFGEAKSFAAEALKRAPGDARVLAIEGARAEAAGEAAAAVSAYERAAAASPKDLSSRSSAARLLLAASPPDRERARRHLEAALAQAPANQYLLFRVLDLDRSGGDRARTLAAFDRVARSVETREARIDRAVAEAKAALEGADPAAADVKVRILENLLRGAPRYQQGRHDVEPGVLAIPLEDWSPELAARLRARPRGVAVRFVPKPSPTIEAVRGVTALSAAGKTGRDLVLAGEGGLVLAPVSKGYAPGAPLPGSAGVLSVTLADTSNSGSLDLVTPGALWLADAGGGSFRRTALAPGEHVIPLDFDSDGDLDLYVSARTGDRLLRNNLDGTWFDATAGIPPGTASGAAVAADFDRDGDPDVVLARAGGGLELLDNLRGGRFAEREAGLPRAGAVTALAAGDLNGDGRPDLVWTTSAAAFVALNRGDGTFLPARELPSGGRPLLFDFDNDGALDLFLSSPGGSSLYRNDGLGSFARVEEALPGAVDAVAVDVDGDGDLDLVLACTDGRARIFENQGGNANGWIDVALEALPTASAKVNRFGYGSEIEIKAGDLYAFRTAAAPVTHVGLGASRRPDVLRVVWTNGVPQNALAPAARTLVREVQQLKGSCPFLYAFDGRAWSFVTDALGRSPAGLLYDGVHQAAADTREWLVVPGDALRPDREGRLQLDLTEELWEAAYIDLAELSALDHPAGVGVVADEKMVPPPFPGKRLYTVVRPRIPRATDEAGRDRTSEIARQDGRHLAGFEATRWQGIVAPHDLVLELPEAAGARRVMLYLTGWIFYADTSIQVALSQSAAAAEKPFGPILEVPDGRGGWRTAIPAMGYPAGKTKTMPVDLSSVLDRRDPRVRIRTNLAVYWDSIAYTVDEEDAPFRLSRAPLVAGDLSFRGFSRMTRETEDGPQVFVHDDVDRSPRWADPAGLYTRFGSVLPLLSAADDRYVVMKGGDAIRLVFDARSLPPLPAGWVRDWLLVLDGWDKDADKNTVAGQTVEPLPFHGMDDARYGEAQEPADAEGMRRFRAEWLTRPGGPGEFRDALRGPAPARDPR
ncbi:MAG: FG-GAP-like repeat-containing protein [Acidobacteriota bacterium]|nr:FG-GAP-like repeat-containing protein [Acidobacteriota bacterium]